MVGAMTRLACSLVFLVAACGGAPTSAHAPSATAAAPPPVAALAPSPCDDVALGSEKTIVSWHQRTAKVIAAAQYDTMLRPTYVVACAEDGWNAEQIACWEQPGPPTPDMRCRMLLSAEQQQKLRARIDAGAREEEEPAGGGGRLEPTGIAACDEYQRALGEFLTCGALSEADRADARTTVGQMASTWQRARRARVSDREAHALEAACRRGLPLLAETSQALGRAQGAR